MVEEVPDIARIKHNPNQKIVERLEVILKMANMGMIDSLALSGTLHSGESLNFFNSESPLELLGTMEILRRDIVDLCMDTKCHKAGREY